MTQVDNVRGNGGPKFGRCGKWESKNGVLNLPHIKANVPFFYYAKNTVVHLVLCNDFLEYNELLGGTS